MKGNLYVVSTPIGNLSDISLRAIDVLRSSEYVFCEDTRVTLRLLRSIKADKNKTLMSYFEHNEAKRIPNVINLLKNGYDVSLVTDSGTPVISDPGFRLVREALKENIKVVPVPGASAILASLVASGLPTDKFIFLGFLPHKNANRIKVLSNLKTALGLIESTVIMFVSPYKIAKDLNSVFEVFGNIEIVICREMTKIYEESRKGRVSDFIEEFKSKKPKGEITFLFSPKDF